MYEKKGVSYHYISTVSLQSIFIFSPIFSTASSGKCPEIRTCPYPSQGGVHVSVKKWEVVSAETYFKG